MNATIKNNQRYIIYPSKVTDLLTFEKTEKSVQDLMLVVQDIHGRELQSFEMVSSQQKIELSLKDLVPGTYFLSVFNGLEKETFKFIKF